MQTGLIIPHKAWRPTTRRRSRQRGHRIIELPKIYLGTHSLGEEVETPNKSIKIDYWWTVGSFGELVLF